MANIVLEGLLNVKWKPTLQSLRYRRVNVQRPRAPHYERARLLALLEPVYKNETLETLCEPSLTCKRPYELIQYTKKIDNPLERILAKEMFTKFESSQLIGFLHKNPISGDDGFNAKIKLKREKINIEVYSNNICHMALKGTMYESVLGLFKTHNAMVFCDEPKVGTLLKILKKIPQYILLAAVVEGRLLSITQCNAYAQFKDITQARAQLLTTLNTASTQLVSRISQPQTTVVSQLQELVKIKEENT